MPFDATGETLRVAGVVKESVVDGPGLRFVIFAQGCEFGCEGCQNPQSQVLDAGVDMHVNDMAAQIRSVKLVTGVTFSGGEPFLQAPAFARLARLVREMGLNLVTFTGHTWEELLELAQRDCAVAAIIDLSWLVVDGRFIISERDISLAFRGSRNQRIIDVARTTAEGEVVLWQPAV